MSAAIVTCYVFESESNCEKIYQTLIYDNGSLSCDCPGWRFKRNALRTCKHVRLVEAGCADRQCKARKDYRNPVATQPRRGANMFEAAGRRLDLTE